MALMAPLEEAREHLRVIRQTMERSTQYSTLSGLSGVLVGLLAIAAVLLNQRILGPHTEALLAATHQKRLLALWVGYFVASVLTDFACNKWRAARVGKYVRSRLGAHIILAALPAFFVGALLTLFLWTHGLVFYIWGAWMLSYGLAICAVGLFSVRPVSYLGGAFVLAGAVTLFLPIAYHPAMMMAAFGGFHIVYGIAMARRHGW